MQYKFLLYTLIAAILTGCSSAYKASQTPDDVYFSPAREGVQKQIAKNEQYQNYLGSEDDQYLRMKIRDRQRWSGIDDYTYWNDSRYIPSYNYDYHYYRNNMYNSYSWNNFNRPFSGFYYSPYSVGGYGMGYGMGYGNYGYSMPGYYNPYYGSGYNSYGNSNFSKNATRVAAPSTNRPNLGSYRNGTYNNRNANNTQGFGNTLKRVFAPSEGSSGYSNSNRSSNTNTYEPPARTYSPERTYSPSSSSPGSSSSGSSGGGVSRPPR